jgi:NAD(P)-dependent dehydrogenase (short-subunit alcohol dehydrogenase family)
MMLANKVALVTGSSRGIGRGIALKLAESGCSVAINYRQNADAANDTLAKVRERGAKGFVIQADVARPEDLRRMLQRVQAEFGRLDIFVSNALGELFSYYAPPKALSIDQWSLALSSGAQSFWLTAQEATTQLMPDGGRIIAITYAPGASTGSWQPYIAQGTAKAALESLVRYFAVALAKRGITVNAISPGFIEDSILNALPAEVQDMVRKHHQGGWTPMGRLGTPADIGNAVVLLCSEQAGWITGQTIAVDGGASLMSPELPLAIQAG